MPKPRWASTVAPSRDAPEIGIPALRATRLVIVFGGCSFIHPKKSAASMHTLMIRVANSPATPPVATLFNTATPSGRKLESSICLRAST